MTFWICLILSLGSFSWASPPDHDQVVILSQNIREITLKKKTWHFGYALATGEDHVSVLFRPESFIFLPKSEQEKILLRHPKLLPLMKFVEPEKIPPLEKSNEDKIKSLRTAYLAPDSQRSLIKFHYSSGKMMEDRVIDEFLGIKYQETEDKISRDSLPAWTIVDWPKDLSQSWFEEIRIAFKLRPPGAGDVVYDLGSGYGRYILYGAVNFPKATFKGVELVKERVQLVKSISDRLGLRNTRLIAEDVLNINLDDGSYFFLFNPFPNHIMDQVLKRLESLGRKKKITVITLHEPGTKLLKAEWLRLVADSQKWRKIRVFESLPVPK